MSRGVQKVVEENPPAKCCYCKSDEVCVEFTDVDEELYQCICENCDAAGPTGLTASEALASWHQRSNGWVKIEDIPEEWKKAPFLRVRTTDTEFKFGGQYFDQDNIPGFSKLPEILVSWGRSNVKGTFRWVLFYLPQDGEYNSYPYVTNPTHAQLPQPPEDIGHD